MKRRRKRIITTLYPATILTPRIVDAAYRVQRWEGKTTFYATYALVMLLGGQQVVVSEAVARRMAQLTDL